MADDQQNPYTMMGMMKMMMPNPYESAQFKDKPMQLQGFRGPATDAMGKPIQSFTDAQAQHDAWDTAHPAPAQGLTLNSHGWDSNGNANAPGSNLNPMGDWSALAPSLPGADQQQQADYARNLGLGGFTDPSTGHAFMGGTGGASGQQGGAAAAQKNPVDMRQAYLDALANPGTPKMGGATVPQSQPLGSPNVMDAFLQQHSGGSKSGNYDNSEFFNTLKNLRGTA